MTSVRLAEITFLRIVLYGMFLAYPTIMLRNAFLGVSANPIVSLANFFMVVALLAGLVAAITLNYVVGYVSFLAVFCAEFLYNMPLLVFTTHLAVALVFAEGLSSLRLYQSVSGVIRPGPHENATASLHACLRRFRSRLVLVASGLFVASSAYGVFPEIVPFASGLASLALYATISIIAIALTALYLGDRE